MDPPEIPAPTVTLTCIGNAFTPLKDDHDDQYGVPTLEELGNVYFNEKFIIINV